MVLLAVAHKIVEDLLHNPSPRAGSLINQDRITFEVGVRKIETAHLIPDIFRRVGSLFHVTPIPMLSVDIK